MMPDNDTIRRMNPSSAPRWAREPEEIVAAQRKLSPRFPSLAEADQRRRNHRNSIIAALLLVLALTFLLASPFAEHTGFCIASGLAALAGFVFVCWRSSVNNQKATL